MNDKRRAEEIKQRTATGIPAMAILVMDATLVGIEKGRSRTHLILNIQPSAGDVYRTVTDWIVDQTAVAQLKRGQTVAVRIDANDPNIVYPDVTWATFSPERLYRTHRQY